MTKITIVGAGNVGATTALFCSKYGDVVLVDVVDGVPQGKALDIQQALAMDDVSNTVTGTTGYEETKDSDIAIVTAGVPRKEGMSRDDLVKINAKIVREVVSNLVKFSPNCILIIVSNPLDAMVYVAYRVSKFPKNRIMGMAGTLDTARFKAFLSLETDVSPGKIEAVVIGGHGDTLVPLIRLVKVDGKAVTELLDKDKIEAVIERTRNGGAEFLPLLKTSAWVAPARAIAEIVEAIVHDTGKQMPVAAYLEGEYGVKDLFIGVPAKINRSGIKEIVEIDLNDEEKKLFDKTVGHVKKIIEIAEKVM